MKVRIAGFTIVPHKSVIVLSHEPSTAGYARITEWTEVDLPDLSEVESKRIMDAAVEAERNDLLGRLARLGGAPA